MATRVSNLLLEIETDNMNTHRFIDGYGYTCIGYEVHTYRISYLIVLMCMIKGQSVEF